MKIPRFIRIRSFRLRIAVLSALVSGSVLALFASLTFTALNRISLHRMDEDIKEFGHQQLIAPRGPRQWDRFGEALRFFLRDQDENTFILLVKDRDDALLYLSPNWPQELPVRDFPAPDAWGRYQPPPPDGPWRPDELKAPEFSTRDAAGTRWRIGMMGNRDLTIALGLNLRRLNEEIVQVRRALYAILPFAILLIAAGAWWISQRALSPVNAVTNTIRQVKAKGLDQRIESRDADAEFAELIALFNDMMGWLERGFQQAIRFSADASHELKTPLTVLQAQLERAIQEAEPGSEEQRRYVAFGEELQRLKSITQKLLLLARIDAGELRLNLRPLNLSRLVEGIAEDSEVLAPSLRIESDIAPGVWVMADADLLKQVVQNLAANAIKYNVKGGFVRFRLHTRDGIVRLAVENSGCGIAPEDRDKLFTRFYRGDKARDRKVSGAGLGLSIAREIVRAHRGELVLEESSDKVTAFSMTLPNATGALSMETT